MLAIHSLAIPLHKILVVAEGFFASLTTLLHSVFHVQTVQIDYAERDKSRPYAVLFFMFKLSKLIMQNGINSALRRKPIVLRP